MLKEGFHVYGKNFRIIIALSNGISSGRLEEILWTASSTWPRSRSRLNSVSQKLHLKMLLFIQYGIQYIWDWLVDLLVHWKGSNWCVSIKFVAIILAIRENAASKNLSTRFLVRQWKLVWLTAPKFLLNKFHIIHRSPISMWSVQIATIVIGVTKVKVSPWSWINAE